MKENTATNERPTKPRKTAPSKMSINKIHIIARIILRGSFFAGIESAKRIESAGSEKIMKREETCEDDHSADKP